eukprot:1147533-Pelagomonas_calceolata.AAC.7
MLALGTMPGIATWPRFCCEPRTNLCSKHSLRFCCEPTADFCSKKESYIAFFGLQSICSTAVSWRLEPRPPSGARYLGSHMERTKYGALDQALVQQSSEVVSDLDRVLAPSSSLFIKAAKPVLHTWTIKSQFLLISLLCYLSYLSSKAAGPVLQTWTIKSHPLLVPVLLSWIPSSHLFNKASRPVLQVRVLAGYRQRPFAACTAAVAATREETPALRHPTPFCSFLPSFFLQTGF